MLVKHYHKDIEVRRLGLDRWPRQEFSYLPDAGFRIWRVSLPCGAFSIVIFGSRVFLLFFWPSAKYLPGGNAKGLFCFLFGLVTHPFLGHPSLFSPLLTGVVGSVLRPLHDAGSVVGVPEEPGGLFSCHHLSFRGFLLGVAGAAAIGQ